jgi:glycosyltransferase involved in cell wall biosynthesis
MKILLLNYEFPPMGGGAGRATFNIARELVQRGHDVDVLTSGIIGLSSVEDLEGVTVYRVKSCRKNIHDCGLLGAFVYVFFAYFKLLKLVRKNDYDILHYFFSMPTGLLTFFPGKHKKIPYIVSIRGSDVPHYDRFNRRLELIHSLLKPLTKRIWNKAKAVVALSKSLRQTALETDPEQEIDIIRNGISTEIFKPLASDNTGKPLKLVAVCRLLERKGIQYVLAAMAELSDPNISLKVVGLGNYETELKRLCKHYSLESAVSFHGYCKNEELPLVFRDSDVFILTSLAESFGIVFLEAMSCALPIIGARTGGIPGIVSEENGILVEPTDVAKIKKAILKMMHQPELRKEMGQMNRKKMIEQYSWRHVANMYLNIYYRSINHKSVFQDVTTMALPEAQDLNKSSTPEVYDDMRL